eukprot:CAMPEP_0178915192 /NCGR_PEP_ID=MMETSP0786-20121207/11882_1 /TAXON_ID=186022 /ORGANISM="Thalassionema frauenfeldii, Strain CCMP 1798" /LENGTH=101 /DNA_ID=CAMNT_0020588259 /DNA_START=437 /DNA_END=742 /DNA_ORIENTATION=-
MLLHMILGVDPFDVPDGSTLQFIRQGRRRLNPTLLSRIALVSLAAVKKESKVLPLAAGGEASTNKGLATVPSLEGDTAQTDEEEEEADVTILSILLLLSIN